jgi:lysine-specific permease
VGDAPFHNGFLGFMTVFLFAGFSFQGTELVGVASGETKNPEVTIPKSIRYVFWRLLLFYIVSILIITLLLPYNDPRLSIQDNVTTSPFTLIFSHYFSNYAADVVNFIILIAVLSAANASMYSSTRVLWYLGRSGQAPKVFSRLNPYAIPIVALLTSALVGSLVFLSSFISNGVLFSYLIQLSTLSGFIAWFGIALSHYYFRKKYLPANGGEGILTYKSRFYPYAQIISMLALGIIMAAQFIPIMNSDNYKVIDVLIIYSSLILFLIIFFLHKFKCRIF